MAAKRTFLDLFSGCGGFSLGFERAGFSCLAAIDFDANAIETFRANSRTKGHVLHEDITKFPPAHLDKLLNGQEVDVIIGGPPCQGFSQARQVDGANHGERLVEDARRHLYENFLGYVAHFNPSVFVMENVLGITSAAGGKFFTRVQAEARALGYRVHGEEIRAWRFGVPQKRIRQLIVGTRRELPIFVGSKLFRETHAAAGEERFGELLPNTTLWEAIGDLPPLAADEGTVERDYDLKRREKHVARYGTHYLLEVLQVHKAKLLTGHVARPHSARDLRDFERLREGEHSAQALARGERLEFPYDRDNFKDRFTRQHRNQLCSTIVAHLSKDGLMFIHPTQNRSLTLREAARVQSFPDWFRFPESRTIGFRLIGNAVPPLVGQAVGKGVRRYLDAAKRTDRKQIEPIPKDEKEAIHWLLPLVDAAERRSLRQISNGDFKRGWYSIGFLLSDLHPDSASSNGSSIVERGSKLSLVEKLVPQIIMPAYEQSGWPVRLVPVAQEAQRRFTEGRLRSVEYYCSDAQIAGASCQRLRGH